MLKRLFPCDGVCEQTRLQCGQALCRCYSEFRERSSTESPSRLAKAARQHLIVYSSLSRQAQ
eukprot:6075700-Alexandrium_andersonii.AAC.2